jgi:retinol-binding protein 3
MCAILASPLCSSADTVLDSPRSSAQAAQPDLVITSAERTNVIEEVLARLNDRYVFPAVAIKMTKAVRARQRAGAYDATTSSREFAAVLTADLREASKDKHLVLTYSFPALPRTPTDCPTDLGASERARCAQHLRSQNFGFRKVELLEGNVGYLCLIGFAPPQTGRAAAEAAMGFLGDADSLIIDVRENEGGSPQMLALLCSYLFEDETKRVHLNDIYSRPDGATHEIWTTPLVSGNGYATKDVYVLTSARTFSTGEELAYDLQALKRATVIGETTGGGAHCGNYERVSDHYVLFVASGRCINPITKTSWEGTGVVPDKAVPADLALDTAYLMALRKAQDKAADPAAKAQIQATIDSVEKNLTSRKAKTASL